MASINATRLKKGMLIKIGEDLFRVLELQHVTPGNLRGFVRIKFRNIRNGNLSDQKLRSEDTMDRAVLDERDQGARRFRACARRFRAVGAMEDSAMARRHPQRRSRFDNQGNVLNLSRVA